MDIHQYNWLSLLLPSGLDHIHNNLHDPWAWANTTVPLVFFWPGHMHSILHGHEHRPIQLSLLFHSGLAIYTVIYMILGISQYNVVVSWGMFYLFNSLRAPLPWKHCDKWWNSRGKNVTLLTLCFSRFCCNKGVGDFTGFRFGSCLMSVWSILLWFIHIY